MSAPFTSKSPPTNKSCPMPTPPLTCSVPDKVFVALTVPPRVIVFWNNGPLVLAPLLIKTSPTAPGPKNDVKFV